MMFSGSVRKHIYFYQANLFSGSRVAAGAWEASLNVWESQSCAASGSFENAWPDRRLQPCRSSQWAKEP